jgi:hypothetical protein
MSKWEEYKQKNKDNPAQTKPWSILNPFTEYTTEELFDKRMEICKACPEFIQLTKQCKKCGCFMSLKAKMTNSTCPIDKW